MSHISIKWGIINALNILSFVKGGLLLFHSISIEVFELLPRLAKKYISLNVLLAFPLFSSTAGLLFTASISLFMPNIIQRDEDFHKELQLGDKDNFEPIELLS